ncbi:MAG: PDZ domain-containing protein [Actinomycetales bacterium]|nr:PDZ domain-containing protein [Actinomycetales bacterium]
MSEPMPPYGMPAPPPEPERSVSSQPPLRRRGPGVFGTVLIAAVVAAIVGAFAGVAGYALGRSVDSRSATSSSASAQVAASATNDAPTLPARPLVTGSIAEIADRTLPAVVSLLVRGGTQEGSGSGFIIRPSGYIVTNNHVVGLAAGGGTITVVFNDGQRAKGTVVGTSPSYDLAVVKVDRKGLPAIELGDSSSVRVGDTAIAIGAPLGLDGTVTSGIISAVDRPVTAGESTADVSFINAIQTDAAINPGNSGGPLLDDAGEVIGVNSAIATMAGGADAGSIGLGFAIPSNSAKRVAEEIIATGTSSTPIMGVQLDTTYVDGGAKVESVTPGSGADDAGLRAGDVIVSLGGRTIDDATELVVAVRSYAPGDEVSITYERNGQERKTALVLGDDSKAS